MQTAQHAARLPVRSEAPRPSAHGTADGTAPRPRAAQNARQAHKRHPRPARVAAPPAHQARTRRALIKLRAMGTPAPPPPVAKIFFWPFSHLPVPCALPLRSLCELLSAPTYHPTPTTFPRLSCGHRRRPAPPLHSGCVAALFALLSGGGPGGRERASEALLKPRSVPHCCGVTPPANRRSFATGHRASPLFLLR